MGRCTLIPRRWTLIVTQTLLLWATLTRALKISTDGTCGGTTGLTCTGSTWGTCCSAHGYCGSGNTYCGKGCDLSSGTCNPGEGSIPVAKPPNPTLGEKGGTGAACPSCPVCTICMSPSPSEVPTSCRLILTATRWATATTTKTMVVSGVGATQDGTTITTTVTAPERVVTETTTVTQTLVRTETLTLAGTDSAASPVVAPAVPPDQDAVSPPTPVISAIIETGPTPSPILPGVVAGCRRWYKTPPDSDTTSTTCRTIAEAAGISKDELRLWNTRIGNTTDDTTICEPGALAMLSSNLCRLRCGDLWGGYYLCVGVGVRTNTAGDGAPSGVAGK